MAAASSNDAGASDPSAPPPQRRVRFQAKFHNQKRVIEVEGLANTTKELMALVLPLLDPLEKAQLILYWNTNTAQTTAQRGTPVISWAMRHDPIHWNPVDVGESNLLEMNTYHGDANSILPPSFFKAKMVWFGYRLCGVVVKGCKCWMLLQRKGKASDEGADGVSALSRETTPIKRKRKGKKKKKMSSNPIFLFFFDTSSPRPFHTVF